MRYLILKYLCKRHGVRPIYKNRYGLWKYLHLNIQETICLFEMSGLLPISCLHISKDRFSAALRYGYARVGLWFEVYTNESPQSIRLFHIVYKFSWIFNTFSQHFNSNILINGTISIYVTSKLFSEIYVG